MNNEFLKMQKLAGLITEGESNENYWQSETNVELLKKILSKIEKLYEEINDASGYVIEDDTYDLVFDTIIEMNESSITGAEDDIKKLLDELDDTEE